MSNVTAFAIALVIGVAIIFPITYVIVEIGAPTIVAVVIGGALGWAISHLSLAVAENSRRK